MTPARSNQYSVAFAERLRAACTAVGIDSPTELAARLAQVQGSSKRRDKLSVSSQAGWWNGTRVPSIDNVERILAITGADGHWLITGDGHQFPIESGVREQAFAEIASIVDSVRRRSGGLR